MRQALTRKAALAAMALAFFFMLGCLAAEAQENQVGGDDVNAAGASFLATNGVVKCTAAIRADGSVAACKNCNRADTRLLTTGEYQVGFSKPCVNIQASNGFSRWVQPDKLTSGTVTAAYYCITADRTGHANDVYVRCQNSSGKLANTSFFLFVAR